MISVQKAYGGEPIPIHIHRLYNANKIIVREKKLVFTSLQSPYTHFGLFWLNLPLSSLSLELLVFCAIFNSKSDIQCVYILKTATRTSRDQIVWWSHLSMWLCIRNHIRFQIHKEKLNVFYLQTLKAYDIKWCCFAYDVYMNHLFTFVYYFVCILVRLHNISILVFERPTFIASYAKYEYLANC